MKKFLLGSLALGALLPVTPSALGSTFGYYIDGKLTHSFSHLGGVVISLEAAPESGSLFLLGAVLAGMALLIFMKSAKPTKDF